MDWRLLSFMTTLAYGVGMFIVVKANRIHGGLVACGFQAVGYALLLLLMGFGRAELARITPVSLAWGSVAAALFCSATYLLFHVGTLFPDKVALTYVISEGWVLITALLVHLLDRPLTGRQWIGVLLVMGGMACISLPAK